MTTRLFRFAVNGIGFGALLSGVLYSQDVAGSTSAGAAQYGSVRSALRITITGPVLAPRQMECTWWDTRMALFPHKPAPV
jgi:hypothetical protein